MRPDNVIRMGYVLAMELMQSGIPLGQLDDETRAAMDFFLLPEHIRKANGLPPKAERNGR